MSVSQEVLAFSESRDPWQQDLLRRLVTKEELNEADFQEVLALLKARFALHEGTPPTPEPLSSSHLTAPPSGAPSVILNSIGDLANVNRLASSQVLSFAVDGLTIIYGDNGSGKSGYCRLLKKLCRVREGGEEDIRGDVFDVAAGSRRAEATVRFTVLGGETTEIRWTTASPPPTPLSRISVFDAKTAALYADQQNRIEFLPHGLDVLTLLAEACQRLAATLDSEQAHLERRIQVALPLVAAGTPTSLFLGRLGPSRAEGDLPSREVIESACEWTEAHALAWREAELAVIESPEKLATGCRDLAQRIQTIEDELLAATLELDDAAVDANLQLWRAAQTARDAAVLAAAQVEVNSLLPGFGSEPWRLLFKYARDYSAVAYSGEDFPVTRDGARCLLCQQVLSPQAIDRFAAFDSYLRSIAEAKAVQAEQARDNARESLDRMSLRSASDGEAVLAQLVDVEAESAVLPAALAEFLLALLGRKDAIVTALRAGSWDTIPALPASLVPSLSALRAHYEAKALGHDAARSPEAERAREAEVNELRARKAVAASREFLLQRRQDLERLACLRRCRRACDTGSISRKNTELRRRYLGQEFQERLLREIKLLDLEYLRLRIEDSSDRGASYLGVGLQTMAKVRNKDILSEGEFRALAIACFLAEVNGVEGHNGIIIDDPVSSLDHQRTQSVALRLVAEATKGRQVIIFTHDLVFFHELHVAAAEAGVPVVNHWVRRTEGSGFGTVFQGEEPWQAKKVAERLKALQAKVGMIRSNSERSGDSYRGKVKDFYSDLRETWERLVEGVLLNGVVSRFQMGVKTQSLKGVQVEDEDYRRVFFGMQRASEFCHDRATGVSAVLPGAEDMERDLTEIRGYCDHLTKRRRTLQPSRENLEKPRSGEIA